MNIVDIQLLEGFFMLLYIWSLYGYYLWYKNKKSGYRTRYYYPETKDEKKLTIYIRNKNK